jgi:hypothetical protein
MPSVNEGDHARPAMGEKLFLSAETLFGLPKGLSSVTGSTLNNPV